MEVYEEWGWRMTLRLELPAVLPRHYALYRCSAANALGRDQRTIQLYREHDLLTRPAFCSPSIYATFFNVAFAKECSALVTTIQSTH